MDDPVAVALKFGFLAVLYLFLLYVTRSSLRDLTQHADESVIVEGGSGLPARARRTPAGPDLRSGVSPHLEVVAAMGREPGSRFDVGGSATLGRASTAEIRIDDPFASSAHARVFPRGQFMFIEDLGSTNGTYVNGRQLRRAEQLRQGDVIRIGDTEYRYGE